MPPSDSEVGVDNGAPSVPCGKEEVEIQGYVERVCWARCYLGFVDTKRFPMAPGALILASGIGGQGCRYEAW